MNSHLPRVALGLCAVSACIALGCSDDPPEVVIPPETEDASDSSFADVGNDSTTTTDGGNDAAPDTNAPDTSVPDTSQPDTSQPDATDLDVAIDTAPDTADAGCHSAPGPDDGMRRLIVAHPYTESGAKANTWRVYELSAAGQISSTNTTFEMGRATSGRVAFTPDGSVGIAVQEDGSLGVFRIDPQGQVTVVHDHFDGGFYAGWVVMQPDGQRAWVLDPNWRENGGGIYAVQIACDGTLTSVGTPVQSKLAQRLVLVPGNGARGLLAATDVLTSPVNQTAHLLNLAADPTLIGGTDAFGDQEAMMASAAVSMDGKYFLIGDNSEFSGIDNRVAVVEVGDTTLTPRQVLTPVEDPVDIVASPFDNGMIVLNGYGNAIFKLTFNASNPAAPYTNAGELTYQGQSPQLPSSAVMIERGSLRGRVLLTENVGIRQVQFVAGSEVATDLGMTPAAGTDLTTITGALGIQP